MSVFSIAAKNKQPKQRRKAYGTRPLHLMLLPTVILLFIYQYIPIAGLVMAFQEYDIFLGPQAFFKSEWVGLQHYRNIIRMADPLRVFLNTVNISFWKIVFGTIVPIVLALMLNEIRKSGIKRTLQTIIYIPHFFHGSFWAVCWWMY